MPNIKTAGYPCVCVRRYAAVAPPYGQNYNYTSATNISLPGRQDTVTDLPSSPGYLTSQDCSLTSNLVVKTIIVPP